MRKGRRQFSAACRLILAAWLVFSVAGMPGHAAPSLGTGQSDGPSEMTVAADGSGQFRTVQDAIAAAPTGTPDHPTIIHIKPGIYHELIYVQREKRFLHLSGEDSAKTVITYGLYAAMTGLDGKPIGTFRTPTATFDADDLTVDNLTFENSAGPKGQALAVRIDGDQIAFNHCRFLGWQDTLFDNRGRHIYQSCDIAGAVDFIFGGGTGYFDNCHVLCLGDGYITAASTPNDQNYGFVFFHCRITADTPQIRTYLGRPWRDFASVVFLNTEMSDVVRPAGWSNWAHTNRDHTARFAEYGSTGPGGDTRPRVPWSTTLSAGQAAALTPTGVVGGRNGWKPQSVRRHS